MVDPWPRGISRQLSADKEGKHPAGKVFGVTLRGLKRSMRLSVTAVIDARPVGIVPAAGTRRRFVVACREGSRVRAVHGGTGVGVNSAAEVGVAGGDCVVRAVRAAGSAPFG